MTSNRNIRRETYGNPLLREQVHDPYHERRKLAGGTLCRECGALYRNGRWIWPESDQAGAPTALCPACRRIRDKVPAGELILKCAADASQLEQILGRIRNIEKDERGQHPLNRIMSVDDRNGDTVVTTTDVHLPHRFGHAITDAWGGKLQTHYDIEGYFARVVWQPADK